MADAAQATEWDEAEFEGVLERLAAKGTIDGRGAEISAEQLKRILDAAPRDPDLPARPMLHHANFAGATFTGDAEFREATFQGGARFAGATFTGAAGFAEATFQGAAGFRGATFQDNAEFRDATFQGDARFRDATFQDNAEFRGATFQGGAGFRGATFAGDAVFAEATFQRTAWFSGAVFQGAASFGRAAFHANAGFGAATFAGDAVFAEATFQRAAGFGGATFQRAAGFRGATFQRAAGFGGATFQRAAGFRGAAFQGDAGFAEAIFQGDARFREATFQGNAEFREATFDGSHDFGPVLARKVVSLDRTVFGQPIRIEVSAETLSCSRAQFRRGADLLVRRAEVALDDADFAEPSMLAPRQRAVSGEQREPREGHDSDGDGAPAPRVVSVRRAKVANLTIAGADMRACRFEGAHGLDQLRLERVRFAETPFGWHWIRWWLPPVRWTRRQAIAEEHQWRAERAGATGWYSPEVQATSGCESVPLVPEQIAAIYRALRKGREDSKDEPGAADFYYGEMEMRRQGPRRQKVKHRAGGARAAEETSTVLGVGGDPPADAAERSTPRGERFILWLYWLVSGYGLRASRALAALAITIALGAVLLDLWGFHAGKRPDDGTLLFAAETSISLLRAPEATNLTAVVHRVQIALRIDGRLFVGLALLSLRALIKR